MQLSRVLLTWASTHFRHWGVLPFLSFPPFPFHSLLPTCVTCPSIFVLPFPLLSPSPPLTELCMLPRVRAEPDHQTHFGISRGKMKRFRGQFLVFLTDRILGIVIDLFYDGTNYTQWIMLTMHRMRDCVRVIGEVWGPTHWGTLQVKYWGFRTLRRWCLWFCTTMRLWFAHVQPNTTDPSGVTHTWHIPITAHVVISLSLATRLSGVRLQSQIHSEIASRSYTGFSFVDAF